MKKRFLVLLLIVPMLILSLLDYTAWAGGSISEEVAKEALQHEIMANKFDDEGKVVEAIKEYEKSLELNPHSVNALFNLGLAYLKTQRVKEAAYTYERAVDLSPKDAEVYKLLGIAYIQQGLKDKAVESWKKSLSLNPDQPKVKEFIEINK